MGKGGGKGGIRSTPDKRKTQKLKGDRGSDYNPAFWYVDGVAYDFSTFVEKHPGGQYALYLGQGRECLPMIHSYHPNIDKVTNMLKLYECPPEDQLENINHQKFEPFKKFTFKKGDFYDVCRREVFKYFEENNISPKGGVWELCTFALNLTMMLFSMYLMCTGSLGLGLLAGTVHGVCRAIMVVQHAHGASHFALSYYPMVNRWVYRFATIVIGLWNPKVWDLQHVVAHHIYTNEWPYDTDSAFPIKSIAYNQRRFWFHKYQHLYMWMVYAFTIPLVFLNSVKDTFIGKQVLYRARYQVKGAYLEAWTVSILGAVYLILPYLFRSFLSAALITVYSNALSSVIFSFQFVVNHEIDKPGVMDGPPPTSVDFGKYQVTSSNTFSGDSPWSIWFAGGLNTQIEHHLFPGIWCTRYHAVRKIVQKVCKDFNIHYNDSPDLLDALACHYRLLRNPPQSIRSGKKAK